MIWIWNRFPNKKPANDQLSIERTEPTVCGSISRIKAYSFGIKQTSKSCHNTIDSDWIFLSPIHMTRCCNSTLYYKHKIYANIINVWFVFISKKKKNLYFDFAKELLNSGCDSNEMFPFCLAIHSQMHLLDATQ